MRMAKAQVRAPCMSAERERFRQETHLENEQNLPAVQVRLRLEHTVREKTREGTGQSVTTVEGGDSETKLSSLVERREVEDDRCGETSFESSEDCGERRSQRGNSGWLTESDDEALSKVLDPSVDETQSPPAEHVPGQGVLGTDFSREHDARDDKRAERHVKDGQERSVAVVGEVQVD